MGETPKGHWLPAEVVGDTWRFDWFPALLTPLPEGDFEVWAIAVDVSGSTSQGGTSVSVDINPPASAVPTEDLPEGWKFRFWEPEFELEPGAQIQAWIDGVALDQESMTFTGDRVRLTLELPTKDQSYELVVRVFDTSGNEGVEDLVHTVNRTGYTCLSPENNFPPPGITLLSSSDDEMGNVSVVYELGDGFVEDTYISAMGGTTVNHGIEQQLGVGQGPDFRSLVKVPDSMFPSCETLTFAQLNYRAQELCSGCPGLTSFDVFMVRSEWKEREVSWEDASDATPWEEPGANGEMDRSLAALGTLAQGEEANLFSLDLTEVANGWRAAGSEGGEDSINRGIIVLSGEDGSRMLYSSEHIDPALRPSLELHFVEGI